MMDLLNFMKQAKNFQEKWVKIQRELSSKKAEVITGGGMVKVIVDGQQNIVSLKIDPQVFQREHQEMVENLIVSAVNEAKRKSQEIATEEIKRMAGGLNIQSLLNPLNNLEED